MESSNANDNLICITSPCSYVPIFRKNEAAGPEWERPSAGDVENIMRNARLDESQAGIKTAGRSINNLRYAEDTTLMA